MIDIGHAYKTGATGYGVEEHDCCAVIAERLQRLFRGTNIDADVIDFPNKSNSEDLNLTIKQANSGGYDLGVSLHCDSISISEHDENGEYLGERPYPDPHGAHVCYYSKSGKELAEDIAKGLCELLPGRSEKTVLRTNLAVLKKTKPVWVLCECGFITNPHDNDMIRKNPELIAVKIYQGICQYLFDN